VHVTIDLAQENPQPRLVDAENFRAFSLVADGEISRLASALGDLGTVDEDGAHAWLRATEVRRLAGALASDPRWIEQFDGMVTYAASKGWVSDDREAIRAHIERT
jgi:hypothetical protein